MAQGSPRSNSGRGNKRTKRKSTRAESQRARIESMAAKTLAREQSERKESSRAGEEQSNRGHRVNVVLNNLSISGSSSLSQKAGMSFVLRVSAEWDTARSQQSEIRAEIRKAIETKDAKPGPFNVDRQVFDGIVRPGERLVIDVLKIHTDSQEETQPLVLRHVLDGPLDEWHGKLIVSKRLSNAASMGNKVSMDFDLKVNKRLVRVDESLGEHIDHAEHFKEQNGESLRRSLSRKESEELVQSINSRINSLDQFDPPSDRQIKNGSIKGRFGSRTRWVDLQVVKNPAPNSSLGFCSRTFRVSKNLTRGYKDIVLPLIAPEYVQRDTIRLFWWDRPNSKWRLVPASCAHPTENAVWGRTSLRGLFAAIGVPRHPLMKTTVEVVKALRPMLENNAAIGISGLDEKICQLIMCTPPDWYMNISENSFGNLEIGRVGSDSSLANESLEATVVDWKRRELYGSPESDPAIVGLDGPIGDWPPDLPEFPSGKFCEDCFGVIGLIELPEIDLGPTGNPWTGPGSGWKPAESDPSPTPQCDCWISIGPTFPSCVIKDVAIDPNHSNIIYAAAQFGGVWKSVNGGVSWGVKTDHLSNISTQGLGFSAPESVTGERTLYVSTRNSAITSDCDLYASHDGGDTWIKKADVPSGERVDLRYQIATGSSDHKLLYLCNSNGLFKSLDGGESWIEPRAFDGEVSQVKIDPFDDNVVWIAVRNLGILVSRDGGSMWTNTTTGIPELSGSRHMRLDIGQDVNGDAGDFIVCSIAGTIAFTRDGGQNWTILPPLPRANDQNGWCSAIAVCPSDQKRVIVGMIRAYVCDDITAQSPTWTHLPGFKSLADHTENDTWHQDVQQIRFDPSDPDLFYLANDGGVSRFRLSNLKAERISNGIVTGQHFHLDVSQTGPFMLGASTYHCGIIKKRSHSLVYDIVNSGENGIYRIDPRNSTIHFNCPKGGGGFKRSDQGGDGAWVRPAGIKLDDGTLPYVTQVEIAPSGTHKVWAGARFDSLFVSTDEGKTFREVIDLFGEPFKLDGTGNKYDGANCIAFDPSDSNRVYIGTVNGRIWSTKIGAVTRAGWTELATVPLAPSTDRSARITSIAVHPDDGSTIYVGYWRVSFTQIFKTSDGGVTWVDVSGGRTSQALPRIPVVDLVFDPMDSNRLFAALDHGIYYTEDPDGSWWQDFNDNFPFAVEIREMRSRRVDRSLYIATMGRGIWQRSL